MTTGRVNNQNPRKIPEKPPETTQNISKIPQKLPAFVLPA
jgi:hypothetical protein